MRIDDATLVLEVKKGHTERFAELVDRHAPAVFRLVRAAIRHRQDAEDLAQEVFVAAYRSLPRMRDPGRFRAYLLTIASRRVIDEIRRRKRRVVPLTLEEDPPAPQPAQVRELLAAIESVVEALPPQARLIFALRHHEGLSCAQIARMLDRPAGTVYSRLSRAHAAIRQALEVKDR